jgi:hypothetical protein
MSRSTYLLRAAVAIAIPALLLSGCNNSGATGLESGAQSPGAASASAAPGENTGGNGGQQEDDSSGGSGQKGQGGGGGKGSAVKLPLPASERSGMKDAFLNAAQAQYPGEKQENLVGPSNVYYGAIRGATTAQNTYWALGDVYFKTKPISRQDGPHVWRKNPGAEWEYIGDTGGTCGQIPRALVQAWGNPCKG